ncbi:MAG: integrin alpha [Phycisphaerales bacterium]|nr:integrin alpha [Phycisphaerales bacterium]
MYAARTTRPLSLTPWATAAAIALAAGSAAAQDFNGDGFADLAVAAPGESIGAATGAGAVTIIYGAGPGIGLSAFAPLPAVQITQATFGLDPVETGDNFGLSMAWGDFNADGFDDLAIGTPNEGIGAATDAGMVIVLYGSPTGLAPLGPPVFTQGLGGMPDAPETGDLFGWSLATGDFNGDGFDDLAIGAPGETVTFADQGVVHQVFGSPGGLMPAGPGIPMFVQSALGDPDEATDMFGYSLASGDFDGDGFDDLAIGAPFETVGAKGACGMVNVVYAAPGFGLDPAAPTAPEVWTQDSPGVPQVANPFDNFGIALAVGDFDGNGADDLAIGVPYESIGAKTNCGAVNVLYGVPMPGIGLDAFAAVPAELWHQNAAGIPEVNDSNDNFGYALAVGDFNGDGFDDLAVGVHFEDVKAINDCGYVNVIYGAGPGFGLDAAAPVPAQGWHQNSPAVPNTNEAADYFGWAIAVGDFDGNGADDLAVGARGEDLGAASNCGAAFVIYGNLAAGIGLDGATPVPSQTWHQNSPGIPDSNESDDLFGGGLAGE